MKKTLSNTTIRATLLSLLFIVSSAGVSVLVNPASAAPNSTPAAAAPAGAAPVALSQAQANWEYPNGNVFNQDFNPQNQINSTNAQYIGLGWLYALPGLPSSLSSLGAARGTVNSAVIVVNGTAIALTTWDQVIAFNVANGNVLWNYASPLAPNQTLGEATGAIPLHTHDGNEWFTTATFGSGVSGPTFWFQGQNNVVYALSATTGKQELNFTDFTGLSMVQGNNPQSIYHKVSSSNIVINQQQGVLVTGLDAESDGNNGRGFFAGWNLNSHPPSIKWISYDVPPQPQSNLAPDPNWDAQMINNMSAAATFFPGKTGTNGYTTPAEVAGGVLMNTNNNLVVDWKSMTPAQLNASLYDDWGQVHQSSSCLAIDGGGSTGSTGSGWGGAWVMGSGQSNGMVFVPTNNKDPFSGPCNPGPDLWSASILALNVSNGHWIWGFQSTAHDIWDYDCSWYQGLANETINGVNTEVIIKTCKSGYMYEINAVTGNLIWSWNPPSLAGYTSVGPTRCPLCYPPNPLNVTWMNADFPTAVTACHSNPGTEDNPSACETGPQQPYLQWPPELAGFEDEQAFDPATNMIYAASHILPTYMGYFGENSSSYFTSTNMGAVPCSSCGNLYNNATLWGIDGATGQIKWSHFVNGQGYRGSIQVSGNMVFMSLSSGDIQMVDATTGNLVRDYYIGAPMDDGISVGASINGQEYILVSVGTCGRGLVTCVGSTPGDVMALTLQNYPPPSGSTSTTTVVSTSTSAVTTTVTQSGAAGQVSTTTVTTTATAPAAPSGVSSVTYGIAAVAVVFIIATGYLAMRGRKPAS